jgi:hypothetical protein
LTYCVQRSKYFRFAQVQSLSFYTKKQHLLVKNLLERVAGIEPACLAWEASALPLSYTRKKFEPPHGGSGGDA